MADERVLSLRELNRTTLARQLLLERAAMPAMRGVERLVGIQAQLARPPFVGLWTRLDGFTRDDLAGEIDRRSIVKATFLRGTLHLLTADDFLTFRATIQPVLASALEVIARDRDARVDVSKLVAAARRFLTEGPRSFAEITTLLTGLVPDGDPGAMRYAVRTHLPLVQVPIEKTWKYPGNPRFALADDWLGADVPTDEHLPELVRRYLAAFGPASVRDMQTWSYLTNLESVFETLASELVRYRDERGRVIFDLPDQALLAADAPAPVRFLPEFDNVLLAHQDRARVVPNEYRSKVYLPGLRVAATVLIDGFVAGTWTTKRVKQAATLHVSAFGSLDRASRSTLLEEGERLARFVEPDARTFEVRFAT